MANRNLCVSRHPIQNGHVSIQFFISIKKISNKNLCFIMFNIHFRFDRCRRQKCKEARTTFIKTGLGTFFKPIFLENSFAKIYNGLIFVLIQVLKNVDSEKPRTSFEGVFSPESPDNKGM
jgi:hypothetical protein